MLPRHFHYVMALFWLMGYLDGAEHPHRGERLRRRTMGLVEFDRRITAT